MTVVTNFGLTSLTSAFYNATNLIEVPTSIPADWKEGDDAMKATFDDVAEYLSKH